MERPRVVVARKSLTAADGSIELTIKLLAQTRSSLFIEAREVGLLVQQFKISEISQISKVNGERRMSVNEFNFGWKLFRARAFTLDRYE